MVENLVELYVLTDAAGVTHYAARHYGSPTVPSPWRTACGSSTLVGRWDAEYSTELDGVVTCPACLRVAEA